MSASKLSLIKAEASSRRLGLDPFESSSSSFVGSRGASLRDC